jgi:hypothetical protein
VIVRAPLDPALRVVVDGMRELRYSVAPAASAGLPAIVRAGSALRRWRDRWVVVQDDVRALAIVDDAGLVEAWAMPPDQSGRRAFDDLRGTKAAKPDFEAAVVLPDGRLVVFGSGAKRVREFVTVADAPGTLRVRAAHELYGMVRAALPSITPNLEAAVVRGDALLLVHRSTGLVGGAVAPSLAPNVVLQADLAAFVAWLDERASPPSVLPIARLDLGTHDGALVGITDAALAPDGRLAFLACAEATGDPVSDGDVVATRFGWLDGSVAVQAPILHADGRPSLLKLEGLEPVPGEPGTWLAVTDADDPRAPASLVRLAVSGR